MANSSRRYLDKQGRMFIPMNVEGNTDNENFITMPKLIVIAVMIGSAIFLGWYLADMYAALEAYITVYLIWGLICFYTLRFYIFEEKFYYRMYKQLKQSEITTPAIFWDISSIRNTPGGAILTYSDARIAVLVKLDRDTITGKPSDFVETHYDAISDFYKEINLRKYNFVQMNIMEQAGNDPRLEELDKLVYKSDNKNIRTLMEKQVGFVKNITRSTLYESDYILFYTQDLKRIDTIIDDAIEICYKLMSGGYIGYNIMDARDVIEFMKEEYGVKYFNYAEATLDMFRLHGIQVKPVFNLTGIRYADGEVQDLTPAVINKINKLTSDVLNGTVNIDDVSIKDTLFTRENKSNKVQGVEFSKLSESLVNTPEHQGKHRSKQPNAHIQNIQAGAQAAAHAALNKIKTDHTDPLERSQAFDPNQALGGVEQKPSQNIRQPGNSTNNPNIGHVNISKPITNKNEVKTPQTVRGQEQKPIMSLSEYDDVYKSLNNTENVVDDDDDMIDLVSEEESTKKPKVKLAKPDDTSMNSSEEAIDGESKVTDKEDSNQNDGFDALKNDLFGDTEFHGTFEDDSISNEDLVTEPSSEEQNQNEPQEVVSDAGDEIDQDTDFEGLFDDDMIDSSGKSKNNVSDLFGDN